MEYTEEMFLNAAGGIKHMIANSLEADPNHVCADCGNSHDAASNITEIQPGLIYYPAAFDPDDPDEANSPFFLTGQHNVEGGISDQTVISEIISALLHIGETEGGKPGMVIFVCPSQRPDDEYCIPSLAGLGDPDDEDPVPRSDRWGVLVLGAFRDSDGVVKHPSLFLDANDEGTGFADHDIFTSDLVWEDTPVGAAVHAFMEGHG